MDRSRCGEPPPPTSPLHLRAPSTQKLRRLPCGSRVGRVWRRISTHRRTIPAEGRRRRLRFPPGSARRSAGGARVPAPDQVPKQRAQDDGPKGDKEAQDLINPVHGSIEIERFRAGVPSGTSKHFRITNLHIGSGVSPVMTLYTGELQNDCPPLPLLRAAFIRGHQGSASRCCLEANSCFTIH